MPEEDMTKYKDIYLSEAREHISLMEKLLLQFEKEPTNMESVNGIFREIHSLKSMSAAMDYLKTSQLCHAVEDVLEMLRRKEGESTEGCIELLFESLDRLEISLKKISGNRREPEVDDLIQKLEKLVTGIDHQGSILKTQKSDKGELIPEKVQSIEVKVKKLDTLMNLVEELLINKMNFERIRGELKNPELNVAVDTLDRLVTDIQYNIMQARMVPIGYVFHRFPRMVRDLSKQEKKEVSLEIRGSDIELDGSMIDEIGESLVHLVRNAIAHGIERPEERTKEKKSLQGKIKLSAANIKNLVIIKISDDGAGLDLEEIKNVAVQRGILSEKASEEEVVNAIFSGLSTTKQVTTVAGRGFGLDIVKNKVESLGGVIKVESRPKEGTTFTIEVPLTLAIIKALLVEVGTKSYAIPLANVERLITVEKREIKEALGHETIILDDESILIARLDRLFGAPSLGLERQPIVIVKGRGKKIGLAVDAFSATQEIVVKPLNQLIRENRYFSGSTIIGSGEVVLILDVGNKNIR